MLALTHLAKNKITYSLGILDLVKRSFEKLNRMQSLRAKNCLIVKYIY